MRCCNQLVDEDVSVVGGFSTGRHGIKKVMVIDHRDCGAYKITFGPEHAKDPGVEMPVLAAVLRPFAAKIKEKYAALDGTVEDVTAA